MRYYVTRTNVMTGTVHYLIHKRQRWTSVIFVGPEQKARCGKYRKKFATRHLRKLTSMQSPLVRKTIVYGLEAAK